MDGVLKLVTAPAALLTTALAKTHLRVDHTNDDTYIDTLVTVATATIENMLSRCLINATWDWFLPTWPGRDVWFPRAPLSSITTVKYLDTDGTQQTLASNQYIAMHSGAWKEPGRLHPAYNVSWPSHREQENTIEIRFVAGYGAAVANVPAELVHAVKVLITHLYDQRSPVVIGTIVAELPFGLEQLIAPFKLRRF